MTRLSARSRPEVIHHFAPCEERSSDASEQRAELGVGVLVRLAVGVVPVARELDQLEGGDRDGPQLQPAERVAEQCDLWFALPCQDRELAVGCLFDRVSGISGSTFSSRDNASLLHFAHVAGAGMGIS